MSTLVVKNNEKLFISYETTPSIGSGRLLIYDFLFDIKKEGNKEFKRVDCFIHYNVCQNLKKTVSIVNLENFIIQCLYEIIQNCIEKDIIQVIDSSEQYFYIGTNNGGEEITIEAFKLKVLGDNLKNAISRLYNDKPTDKNILKERILKDLYYKSQENFNYPYPIKYWEYNYLYGFNDNAITNVLSELSAKGLLNSKALDTNNGSNKILTAYLTIKGVDKVEKDFLFKGDFYEEFNKLNLTPEELMKRDESENIERKSSLNWDFKIQKNNSVLIDKVMNTLCAFANTKGGYMIIGQNDNKLILGLANDYQKTKNKNRDSFLLKIEDLLKDYFGISLLGLITKEVVEIEEKDICIIKVSPSKLPIFSKREFFIRTGPRNIQLNTKDFF